MPVLLAPLADPFDVVMQGEQLRSLALTQGVDGPGFPAPFVTTTMEALMAVSMVVADDGDDLWMMGNDWSQGAPHESQAGRMLDALVPRANAFICTPCGALIPHARAGLILNPFLGASQLWVMQGVTVDEARVPLGNCRVVIFNVGQLAVTGSPVVAETISDGSGNYSVAVPGPTALQAIAYKPGSPDVAGITRADVVPDANG